MPEGAPRLAAIAAAAAMMPGGATPGTSTHPPRHNLGGTTAADAAAAKRKAADAAAAALASAIKRAEKGQERESKLLPVGTWCHKGTCRWKHGPNVPCTSDPDWDGPLDPEIEKDAAHVARIEGRRDAAAKRLHEEGKRSSPFPKKLKKHSVARPGGAATFAPPVDDDPSGDGMGRLQFLESQASPQVQYRAVLSRSAQSMARNWACAKKRTRMMTRTRMGNGTCYRGSPTQVSVTLTPSISFRMRLRRPRYARFTRHTKAPLLPTTGGELRAPPHWRARS